MANGRLRFNGAEPPQLYKSGGRLRGTRPRSSCDPVVAAFVEAAQTRKGESDELADEEDAEHGAFAHVLDAPQQGPMRHDQGRERVTWWLSDRMANI